MFSGKLHATITCGRLRILTVGENEKVRNIVCLFTRKKRVLRAYDKCHKFCMSFMLRWSDMLENQVK